MTETCDIEPGMTSLQLASDADAAELTRLNSDLLAVIVGDSLLLGFLGRLAEGDRSARESRGMR